MGADQVAAIRPAIAELEADEQERAPHSPARCFARFSRPPDGNPWIEVYLESETVVNLWYPHEAEPLTYLEKLGVSPMPGMRVTHLIQPACTIAFSRVSSMALARFLDSLFTGLFACGDDYPVDVEMCRFPEDA